MNSNAVGPETRTTLCAAADCMSMRMLRREFSIDTHEDEWRRSSNRQQATGSRQNRQQRAIKQKWDCRRARERREWRV